MNICKNCRFAKISPLTWMLGPFSYKYAKCSRSDEFDIDVVTGKVEKTSRRNYCSSERRFRHLCGPEGTFYQDK